MAVYLHSLSTVLPPNRLSQSDVKQRTAAIFSKTYPQFNRLVSTFDTAGIENRYSVVPLEWFSEEHGWNDRNETFLGGAKSLFIDATNHALKRANWMAEDVDCVITVCSTGIATPSLEAQVFKDLGFRNNILRVPIFGLGCAGGVSGLATARSISAGRPGQKVLLVVVETCTLSFRADRMQKADIIAAVLFGDGAAAACISTVAPEAGQLISLSEGHQVIWPDTLEIMGWDVDDTGFGVVFDRSIPSFVTQEFASAVQGALEAASLTHDQVDRYVCHPGGAKVLEAIEGALDLEQGSLRAEKNTLRDFGNMSAPTVFFVMKEVLQSGASGQMMACALGPGFTASFLAYTVTGTDA